ncbi:MAG: hypothetical protein GY804_00925, partial [Alphaproteobacteria bacterium]|nr:hypothetical protein [Alphaproteobacteria bacterium]
KTVGKAGAQSSEGGENAAAKPPIPQEKPEELISRLNVQDLKDNSPVPVDGTKIREKIKKGEDRSEEFFNNLVPREGTAFTNDPADKGGATKIGVTQDTLDAIHDKYGDQVKGVPKDVKQIDLNDARKIYRLEYFYDKRINEIDNKKIAEHMYDIYSNHSPTEPSKWLQKALNEHAGTKLKVDGVVGSKTIKALNETTKDPAKRTAINNSIADARIAEAKEMVQKDPKQAKFIKGWVNRFKGFYMD